MEKNNTPYFLTLSRDEQKSLLEALIFATDEPLSYKSLFKILITSESSIFEAEIKPIEGEEVIDENQITLDSQIADTYHFTQDFVDSLIDEINESLAETGRVFTIVKFAGGFQFATRKEYGEMIHSLIKSKTKRRLSQAALETLAIIAYRQPITKPEIEQIRGVSSSEVVNSLIEKNFVRIAGRKDVLGKPLLYATTPDFLRTFGLRTIEDLPKLRDLEELADSAMNSSSGNDEITLTITDEDALPKLNGETISLESIIDNSLQDIIEVETPTIDQSSESEIE